MQILKWSKIRFVHRRNPLICKTSFIFLLCQKRNSLLHIADGSNVSLNIWTQTNMKWDISNAKNAHFVPHFIRKNMRIHFIIFCHNNWFIIKVVFQWISRAIRYMIQYINCNTWLVHKSHVLRLLLRILLTFTCRSVTETNKMSHTIINFQLLLVFETNKRFL